MIRRSELHPLLEDLYTRYTDRAWATPDPIEIVYGYARREDREVAGYIAAALAYGRAAQIRISARRVLDRMGPSPHAFLCGASSADLDGSARGFRHRWTDEAEMRALLHGLQDVLRRHGSLEACFCAHQPESAADSVPGLTGLIAELRGDGGRNSLLPDASKTSACKRLHMYLRWMVRRDAIDPGCWSGVSSRVLLVPLDTHLFRIARAWRMTRRKQADLTAARQVTAVFRRMNPDDPVRYDFVLTRFGIRPDMDLDALLDRVRRGAPQSMRSTPTGTSQTMVRSTSGNCSAI
jgi:uncharacterized protein (TIGR02757 family)